MATRRLDKVNELMKREIGSFVQKEFEWNGTIVSILQVEITEDLKEGRVWVGVVGRMSPAQVIDKHTEGSQQACCAAQHAAPHLQARQFRTARGGFSQPAGRYRQESPQSAPAAGGRDRP